MLKKLRATDIDVIMNIWKKEFVSNNKKVESKVLTEKYTSIQDELSNPKNSTLLYTEDDVIEGFVSINENNEIFLIYVEKKIRREGIGSKLLDACKKKYSSLSAKFDKNNSMYRQFFTKNDFSKTDEVDENSSLTTYKWNSTLPKTANVIYFDDDLNEDLKSKNSDLKFYKIEIKDVLKDGEVRDIKTYLKVRKLIEQAFKAKKVILYQNYNNYVPSLDELIKELVKIEKVNFGVAISEPLVIEKQKSNNLIDQIESSYKDYKIYKIDTESELKKDVAISQIFDEKMKIILSNLENIAQNM
ncbi:MAG: GNAT family N-acetyltransferase [Clostridia bacterium]|nr:GNAT family N-acetyltransferase [Clostridia bacterium]